MQFESAAEIVKTLGDRWPKLIECDADRQRWIGWFLENCPEQSVAIQAVRNLSESWKERRPPTMLDMRKAAEHAASEVQSRSKWAIVDARVAELRLRYGDVMLSMFAKASDQRCPDCCDAYLPRGMSHDEPLLFHQHFTAREADDTALLLAITTAKKKVPTHPLEAIAPLANDVSKAYGRDIVRMLIRTMTPQLKLFPETPEGEPR